jgi:hypothetical protein
MCSPTSQHHAAWLNATKTANVVTAKRRFAVGQSGHRKTSTIQSSSAAPHHTRVTLSHR